MKTYEKYITEQASKHKKEYIRLAKEIIGNFVKQHDGMLGTAQDFIVNAKQLQVSIVTVMGTMVQGRGPAYAMYKKYMPKKYNEDLFATKTGDLNSSEWAGMTDDKQFTIAREATLEYAKENNIPLRRQDIMIRR